MALLTGPGSVNFGWGIPGGQLTGQRRARGLFPSQNVGGDPGRVANFAAGRAILAATGGSARRAGRLLWWRY